MRLSVARLALSALAALIAQGVAHADAPLPPPRPPVVVAPPEPLALDARVISLTLPADARVRYVGGLALTATHPRFGGLSGLAAAPDGAGFVAVSDRGVFVSGRLVRRAGALSGVADARLHPMLDLRGEPVRGAQVDAEGLAQGRDGALFVAFEGDARVWRYAGPGARATATPMSPAFAKLQRNSGLEALAITADGTLLAIAERSGALERPFPVFRLDPGADQWKQGALPRDPPFLPVGAAVGPDGQLYVLERDFNWLAGFSTRLRRASLEDWPDLRPETLLTLRGGIDNFEGLAAWRDAQGAVRLLMVGDDNFSPLQRTAIFELAVE